MTARIARNESSSPSQPSNTPDQQVLTSDVANAVEPEAEYVPEREFVLMPLFRRIGEMFGLRRNEEPEYIYAPEEVSSQPGPIAEVPQESASAPQAQNLHDEETEAAPIAARATTEDILEIEQESAPETETPDRRWAFEHKIADVPQAQFQPQPEETSVAEPTLPEPVLQSAELHAAEFEPAIVEEAISPPPPITARVEIPQPTAATSAMTQQDANNLVAQIREAASKISTAVSQAAEWLQSKEEEILHRAETSGTGKPIAEDLRVPQLEQILPSSLEALAEIPEWENKEAPALQRELAWGEKGTPLQARGEATVSAGSQPAKAEAQKRRLQLVSQPAALPLWKRIDWAQQFAPKRVAILGALVMAILMVLGISLARRPAASVLPQQTRTIEPGGVTLTTHPATPPAASPAQSQTKPSASRPAATPTRSQAHRAGSQNDGPDVVTHYYRKPKPSPVRQAASSGVRHYSDLQ